ncbi:MAG TPA: tripartite tricarboxylate transporter substrate binding protein [Xanthobacteraceae bacterium]|jgi:tripartite-type tricarboxylate transporter receptor subunit TctC
MKLLRRQFLHLAAGVAALPLMPHVASALDYPTRPVRWVVGFPPGGPNDITARLMAEQLSARLHQPFIVENRPGASSNVATEMVVKSPPDGYTIMELATVNSINVSLYQHLNYDFLSDILVVAGIAYGPAVMLVNPTVPAQSVPAFIAYAKANPGKINMGSAGSGTPQQIIGEMFKMMTGVDMVHVPYHGSAPELVDLIAGHVQVAFEPVQSCLGYIKAGTLRALAVSTARRANALPDVPTLSQFIPGFEARTWQGLGAPKHLPAEIVDALNKEVNAALTEPALQARLADLGIAPMPMTPAECQTFITAEVEKWAKVIKFASIKPE